MNIRRKNLYLLAAALLTASCAVGERYQTTINRQWPAATIRTVDLSEVNGSVTIEAANPGEVTLEAHVVAHGVPPKKGAENEGYFTSSIEGDTLTVGRKGGKHSRVFFWDREDVSVNYVLHVPKSVSLDISTVNGKIATRGVAGETSVTTVNGAVSVEATGTNPVSARTVNGRVRATFSESFQGATLKTVNGGIEAELPQAASFSCDLSQVNGDFEAGFPLSIHSNPGSRRVSGTVNGGEHQLKITTVNGDVSLVHIPAPPVAPVAPTSTVPPSGVAPAPPAPPVAPLTPLR